VGGIQKKGKRQVTKKTYVSKENLKSDAVKRTKRSPTKKNREKVIRPKNKNSLTWVKRKSPLRPEGGQGEQKQGETYQVGRTSINQSVKPAWASSPGKPKRGGFSLGKKKEKGTKRLERFGESQSEVSGSRKATKDRKPG